MLKDQQLGSLEKVYSCAPVANIISTVGVVLLFLHALFYMHSWSYLPVYLSAASLLIAFIAFFVGGRQVLLCTEGLLYVRILKRKSINWKSISEVRREMYQNYVPPSSFSSATFLTIILRNEHSISFPDFFTGLFEALKVRGTQHGFRVVETFNDKITKVY